MLNDSYGFLQGHHFDVVYDSGSSIPFFRPSNVQSKFVHVLTRPYTSTLTH
jgi:hypothetical protein